MKTLKTTLLTFAIILFSIFNSNSANAQEKPQLTDPEIASVAVTANQIDVDYAAIAIKKSSNKDIINFAKTMQTDHLAVIGMATKLAEKLHVTPKSNAVTQSLLDGAKKMKSDLNSKSGKAFNKAYIDNEVAYHKSVIQAVETILIPQTKNSELKDLLIKVLPSLKVHLEHALMVQKNFK
ncbi:MAG: DUF4142 domain-containing protein [Chitinophagales bacterium]|nr:DUF4142 domain-containing protein [Chitinophagales bacterium]